MAGGNLPNAVKGVSVGGELDPFDIATPFYIRVYTTLHVLDNAAIQISDNARSWKPLTAGTLTSGKHYFRTTETASRLLSTIVDNSHDEYYDIGGNINSLTQADFADRDNPPANTNIFNGMKIVSAAELRMTTYFSATKHYQAAFRDCIHLTKSPLLLVVQTLTQECYESMFHGCSALTTVPVIQFDGVTKKWSMKNMFAHSGITESPVLRVTTWDTWACESMFESCSNLTKITCISSAPQNDGTYRWCLNVASVGTFVKKRGVEWPTGTNSIPTGWTVEEID